MNRIVLPLLTAVFVALPAFAADESVGSLDFKNAGVDQVLPLYKSMSGLELCIDSRVKKLGFTINLRSPAPLTKAEAVKQLDSRVKKVGFTVDLRSSAPLTKAEAVKQIEKALLEQACVVITRLDDKRASVTYNDALPIAPPSNSPDQ